MASSIPIGKNPYHVCRLDCYLQLDDQCMKDCEERHRPSSKTKTKTRKVADTKVWPYVAGAGVLLILVGGYYIVKHQKNSVF